jgi:hypothetical protein
LNLELGQLYANFHRAPKRACKLGRGEASKFWLGVGVKIRIFYVMGLQDMEYWHG